MGTTVIKHLPRKNNGDFERTFTANGHKYVIRSQEEGIGIRRYSKLLNFSAVWGFQADIASQLKAWKDAVNAADRALIGKGSFGEFFAIAQNAVNGLNRLGKTDYTFTFWICCLFVVREGEDMTEWVEDYQEEKIGDWVTEGLHEADFEYLVKKKLPEFSRQSSKSSPSP